MKIPEGYQAVTPYLILKDAEKFLKFTKDLFGATEVQIVREENRIVHGEVKIVDSIIMFADNAEKWAPQPAGLFIYVDNADESYKKAIELGATSIMEPANQSYGRSCGVLDQFGNSWWITSA